MKTILFFISVILAGCSARICGNSDLMLQKYQEDGFEIKSENLIYYKGSPFAKLQAMTFSLDDNKLVKEINVRLLSGVDISRVPDLIKFIHLKHHDSEVEVEMEMN